MKEVQNKLEDHVDEWKAHRLLKEVITTIRNAPVEQKPSINMDEIKDGIKRELIRERRKQTKLI